MNEDPHLIVNILAPLLRKAGFSTEEVIAFRQAFLECRGHNRDVPGKEDPSCEVVKV